MEALRKETIKIDIRKQNMVHTPSFIQHDTNILMIEVYDGGEPADLSNIAKVIVNFKRLDKKVFSREMSYQDNVIEYQIGQPEMDVAGNGQVEVQLYDIEGNRRISLSRFKVDIRDEIGTDEVRDDNEDLTLLQEIFVEVKGNGDYAKAQADNAKVAAESAITNWLSPVANKAAVDAINKPKLGDTVQALDNGYVYRYNGSKWVNTQGYGATALANVNAQLADKASTANLNTEKARIDNLVANAGNVSGNAELQDIRVGGQGDVYVNAGDALRSITNGQLTTSNVLTNRWVQVTRKVTSGKTYYVSITGYSGTKLTSVATFLGTDTTKDFTFSGVGQLKSFIAWRNADYVRFYVNLSSGEDANISIKIFSEDDVLGLIEKTNKTLSDNIKDNYSIYSKTGASIDIDQSFSVGEKLRFNISEYNGANLKSVSVFLYTDATTYSKLGDYQLGDVITFIPQSNLVKIRFYSNATPTENVSWTVKIKKIEGRLVERVENTELDVTTLKKTMESLSKGKGIKWNFLGDSFTAPNNAYHSYIRARKGIIVNNYGISGSAVTTKGTNPMVTRFSEMTNDCDVISVFGGINDSREIHVGQSTLGNIADTSPDTFYGAYKTLIEGLIDKYPSKVIFTITPPHLPTSDYSQRLGDVSRAIVEVSYMYGVPCLDLYKSCNGFNGRSSEWSIYHPVSQVNVSGYDIHPNPSGQNKLSIPIENFFLNLIV